MHPEGFADLWEHVRLLSDDGRTDALVRLLERHAPGRRVLEVGCGTGLLSCVAAALGAREVVAVEPTWQADLARQLVHAAGLGDRVEVVEAAIEDLSPRPMDLVFSELLNADPFAEGVVEVSRAARAWLADGGLLAPSHLRLWAAAVRADDSHVEAARAARRVLALEDRLGVSLGPLIAALRGLEPYASIHPSVSPAGRAVQVLDLPLGTDAEPPDGPVPVVLPVWGEQPVAGITVFFEAPLDDGLVLHNRPGGDGHWGHLVVGWPRPVRPVDGGVRVVLDLSDGELDARPEASP